MTDHTTLATEALAREGPGHGLSCMCPWCVDFQRVDSLANALLAVQRERDELAAKIADVAGIIAERGEMQERVAALEIERDEIRTNLDSANAHIVKTEAALKRREADRDRLAAEVERLKGDSK